MTLGSLFDGSGGFPLGGLLNGITPLWSSEIEPFPIMVTHKRLPDVKHYGDVSKVSGADLAPVDIITFGSPCQDLSVAGKRAGLEDGERSNLFYQAVRIIKEMRNETHGRYPRYAVWENVPGAFSSNQGADFQSVLKALCEVVQPVDVPRPKKWSGAGQIVGDSFSLAWRTFDAQYWGVPQRRRRIYLVADFGGHSAGKILFESEGLPRHFSEGRTPWKGTTADTKDGSGVTDQTVYGWHRCDTRADEFRGVSESVVANYGTGGNNAPMVVNTTVAIDGNGQRESHRGDGYKETDRMYTINTAEQHAVAFGKKGHPKSADDATTWDETDVEGTINTFDTHSEVRTNELIVQNDQGGQQLDVSVEKTGTLRAQEHGHQPITFRCVRSDQFVEDNVGAALCREGAQVLKQGAETLVTFSQDAYDKYTENEVCATLGPDRGVYGGGSETLVADTFSQDTYSKYSENDKAGSLKNSGGNIGGGSEVLVAERSSTRSRLAERQKDSADGKR